MKVLPVILATVIIFGTGVITGGLLVRETSRPKPGYALTDMIPPPNLSPVPWQIQRHEFLMRMERQMALTIEQKQKIEKIIRESQDRTKPLWEFIAPDLREELENVRTQIFGELTVPQQKQFNELLLTRPNRRPGDAPGPEDRRRGKRDSSEGPNNQPRGATSTTSNAVN